MAADTGATEARTDGATAIQAAAHLTFGTTGNAVPSQVSGFSWPEDGYTWALGPQAVLRVKLQPGHGDLMLELSLRPFMLPPYMVRQRVGLTVDGTEIGVEWAQDDSVLGFRIPAALVEGSSEILIKLALPDAASPSDLHAGGDSRRLGGQIRGLLLVWIPPEPKVTPRRLPPLPCGPDDPPERLAELARFCTGLDLPQLAEHFESLGHNCEFGLVQRHFGAEQLGLLRFAGVALEDLVEGLARRFENLGDSITVIAVPNNTGGGEYFVNETAYNISFHTFISINDETPDRVRQSYIRYLSFQRRVFLERLEAGGCICIVHRRGTFSPAQARALLLLLRTFGPNSLLYIDESPLLPSGAVEQLDHGLYHGKLAAFAPLGDAGNSDLPGWASLCVNTYRLWRAGWGKERPGGSAPFSPPPHTDSSSRAPAT